MTVRNEFPGLSQPPLRATRERPTWATQSIGDAQAIEHWRLVGRVTSAEGHESLIVEVVQRDEFDDDPDSAWAHEPAQVLVAGVRLTTPDARALGLILVTAADLIDPQGLTTDGATFTRGSRSADGPA